MIVFVILYVIKEENIIMCVINDAWLKENVNTKVDHTFGQRLVGYLGTGEGVFREVQVLREFCRIGSNIPSSISPIAENILEHANNTLAVLSIASLYSTPKDFLKGVDRLQDGRIQLLRKVGVLFKDIVGNFTPWLNAGMFLSGSFAFKNVVWFTNVASHCSELTFAISDYYKAKQLESQATKEEFKAALIHSKNFYWYKTAKMVFSVTSTLLGSLVIYTGVTVSLSVGLSALSLVTIFLSIRTDLYKEEGRYQVIKFDKQITLDESEQVV